MSQKWAPTIPKDAARSGDLGKRVFGLKFQTNPPAPLGATRLRGRIVSYQLSVISYQLSAISFYQVPAISYKFLSAISSQQADLSA